MTKKAEDALKLAQAVDRKLAAQAKQIVALERAEPQMKRYVDGRVQEALKQAVHYVDTGLTEASKRTIGLEVRVAANEKGTGQLDSKVTAKVAELKGDIAKLRSELLMKIGALERQLQRVGV